MEQNSSNDMSSFSEKLVDFDIMVETEPRMIAPAKPTSLTEQTSSLEESIYKLSGSLSSIQRTQKCELPILLSMKVFVSLVYYTFSFPLPISVIRFSYA